MECTNCCSEGGWSPQRAVLAGETTVEVVFCDACREALHDEEWIEIEEADRIRAQ